MTSRPRGPDLELQLRTRIDVYETSLAGEVDDHIELARSLVVQSLRGWPRQEFVHSGRLYYLTPQGRLVTRSSFTRSNP